MGSHPRVTKKVGDWGSELRSAWVGKPAGAHGQQNPLTLDLNPGGRILRPLSSQSPSDPLSSAVLCPEENILSPPPPPSCSQGVCQGSTEGWPTPVPSRVRFGAQEEREDGGGGGIWPLPPPHPTHPRRLTVFLEAGSEGGGSEVVSELRRVTSGQALGLQGHVPPASPQKWEGGDHTESTSPLAAAAVAASAGKPAKHRQTSW